VFVDGVCHCSGLFAIAVCCIADELNDFVERMLVVVPNDDGVLVFLHGVCSGLKAKVGFIRGHARFVWRAVEGVEKKIKGIADGAAHVVPEFWREGGAEWIVRDGRDVYVGDGGRKYSWGYVSGGIKDTIGVVEEGMEGTLDVATPGLGITAVAAPTGLLCDEEADVVVLVRAGTEAAAAKNTAFVEGTVSDGR
jgi:hypothetical protein